MLARARVLASEVILKSGLAPGVVEPGAPPPLPGEAGAAELADRSGARLPAFCTGRHRTPRMPDDI